MPFDKLRVNRLGSVRGEPFDKLRRALSNHRRQAHVEINCRSPCIGEERVRRGERALPGREPVYLSVEGENEHLPGLVLAEG